MCTVSTKFQRERPIRNFERVLFNNCVLALEYMRIEMKLNMSAAMKQHISWTNMLASMIPSVYTHIWQD